MQKIIKQFPVLGQNIYADTAASGLLYDGLLDWRQEHDFDFLIGGSKMRKTSYELLSQTKDTLGTFFGCKAENVALVPNFSMGLNLLLEGMPKTVNVLLLEDDYPSLNWPFESRMDNVSFVKINEDLEERILAKIKSDHINVLALSLVQWLNGVKVDLDFLKSLKNDFPELLIIADGTQFCGTQQFNFDTSGIDVLGASGYKWLLGGYGNGFMMFKEGVSAKFSCKSTGFYSANHGFERKEQISFVKQFEPGHLDTFNFGSLNYSLKFLTEIGLDKVYGQIEKLTQKAKEEFAEAGLLEEAVIKRKEHSSIFKIKDTGKLWDKLNNNEVVCSQRGDGIRLSFHFYNTEKEIEKVVRIIKSK
ncbi:aminotransferase class V-fold PLP-dependent enzyme [Arenibacter sp. 6A1]|uniref:aminotransferase class V-fold PLP-dependent enzyme n=1 Tax=Arenibacter sp. 6A1 TaxID=2720391 RepID=UPI001445F682|nr:aminotransferase class V-fold PLP-dependent enzyme [Arenibacter sp. 6A1]NKI25627.1 aminotransferase class V-fold PLP-dependent enzyme [Arenibacter sp. 6A1]